MPAARADAFDRGALAQSRARGVVRQAVAALRLSLLGIDLDFRGSAAGTKSTNAMNKNQPKDCLRPCIVDVKQARRARTTGRAFSAHMIGVLRVSGAIGGRHKGSRQARKDRSIFFVTS